MSDKESSLSGLAHGQPPVKGGGLLDPDPDPAAPAACDPDVHEDQGDPLEASCNVTQDTFLEDEAEEDGQKCVVPCGPPGGGWQDGRLPGQPQDVDDSCVDTSDTKPTPGGLQVDKTSVPESLVPDSSLSPQNGSDEDTSLQNQKDSLAATEDGTECPAPDKRTTGSDSAQPDRPGPGVCPDRGLLTDDRATQPSAVHSQLKHTCTQDPSTSSPELSALQVDKQDPSNPGNNDHKNLPSHKNADDDKDQTSRNQDMPEKQVTAKPAQFPNKHHRNCYINSSSVGTKRHSSEKCCGPPTEHKEETSRNLKSETYKGKSVSQVSEVPASSDSVSVSSKYDTAGEGFSPGSDAVCDRSRSTTDTPQPEALTSDSPQTQHHLQSDTRSPPERSLPKRTIALIDPLRLKQPGDPPDFNTYNINECQTGTKGSATQADLEAPDPPHPDSSPYIPPKPFTMPLQRPVPSKAMRKYGKATAIAKRRGARSTRLWGAVRTWKPVASLALFVHLHPHNTADLHFLYGLLEGLADLTIAGADFIVGKCVVDRVDSCITKIFLGIRRITNSLVDSYPYQWALGLSAILLRASWPGHCLMAMTSWSAKAAGKALVLTNRVHVMLGLFPGPGRQRESLWRQGLIKLALRATSFPLWAFLSVSFVSLLCLHHTLRYVRDGGVGVEAESPFPHHPPSRGTGPQHGDARKARLKFHKPRRDRDGFGVLGPFTEAAEVGDNGGGGGGGESGRERSGGGGGREEEGGARRTRKGQRKQTDYEEQRKWKTQQQKRRRNNENVNGNESLERRGHSRERGGRVEEGDDDDGDSCRDEDRAGWCDVVAANTDSSPDGCRYTVGDYMEPTPGRSPLAERKIHVHSGKYNRTVRFPLSDTRRNKDKPREAVSNSLDFPSQAQSVPDHQERTHAETTATMSSSKSLKASATSRNRKSVASKRQQQGGPRAQSRVSRATDSEDLPMLAVTVQDNMREVKVMEGETLAGQGRHVEAEVTPRQDRLGVRGQRQGARKKTGAREERGGTQLHTSSGQPATPRRITQAKRRISSAQKGSSPPAFRLLLPSSPLPDPGSRQRGVGRRVLGLLRKVPVLSDIIQHPPDSPPPSPLLDVPLYVTSDNAQNLLDMAWTSPVSKLRLKRKLSELYSLDEGEHEVSRTMDSMDYSDLEETSDPQDEGHHLLCDPGPYHGMLLCPEQESSIHPGPDENDPVPESPDVVPSRHDAARGLSRGHDRNPRDPDLTPSRLKTSTSVLAPSTLTSKGQDSSEQDIHMVGRKGDERSSPQDKWRQRSADDMQSDSDKENKAFSPSQACLERITDKM